MPRYQVYIWGLQLTWLLFVFAFGACIGSLINVLVYRLPRGIGVVTPPSRCPKCDTRLTFRENLPIIGWLLLRGKCRYCGLPISPEYPLVEAFVAVLFSFFYVLCFMTDPGFTWLGVHWGAIRPEWAHPQNPLGAVVPLFVLLLFLLGSLVAMTLVDARTFTIPLVLTWVPAILALVIHVGDAAYTQVKWGRLWVTAPGHIWAIPTPVEVEGRQWYGGWGWILASVGSLVGLGIGNLLLLTGLIGRSFDDYHEWEEKALAEAAAASAPVQSEMLASPLVSGALTPAAADVPIPAVAPSEQPPPPSAEAQSPPDPARPADVWIQYPHARREMVRELAFLAPCFALGLLGWSLARWVTLPSSPPLWAAVLGGVLMGYLIGGGVVWAVRILGSLGFGKEAMGMGDVHLMAGVGACLGWIDATLAFFVAAFVGIFLTLLMALRSGAARRTMPYGPSLAIASVLILLCKPLVEGWLSSLLGRTVNLP